MHIDPKSEARRARLLRSYNDQSAEERHVRAKNLMNQIDALPAQWRALVHQHGWTTVHKLRERNYSYEEAEAAIRSFWLAREMHLHLNLEGM